MISNDDLSDKSINTYLTTATIRLHILEKIQPWKLIVVPKFAFEKKNHTQKIRLNKQIRNVNSTNMYTNSRQSSTNYNFIRN